MRAASRLLLKVGSGFFHFRSVLGLEIQCSIPYSSSWNLQSQ